MTYIMENIIFNELIIRECAVDIGIVYSSEKNAKGRPAQVAREIDFIAHSGGKKACQYFYYTINIYLFLSSAEKQTVRAPTP